MTIARLTFLIKINSRIHGSAASCLHLLIELRRRCSKTESDEDNWIGYKRKLCKLQIIFCPGIALRFFRQLYQLLIQLYYFQ